jgi:hypothetical protein
VLGKDYEYAGDVHRGCGPFTHNNPQDRPSDRFGGAVRVHTGVQRASHLLLPIIP